MKHNSAISDSLLFSVSLSLYFNLRSYLRPGYRHRNELIQNTAAPNLIDLANAAAAATIVSFQE